MEVFYERGKKYNYRSQEGKPYFRKTATINGKRRNFYGDGEKDANNKIEEARALATAGFDFDKRSAKTKEVFRYWLFNVKRVDHEIKASTFARYEGSFRLYIEPYQIGNIALSKLDTGSMQAYVSSMYEEHGVSGATIKATIKVWRMFTKWACEEGYLVKNPCRNISLPGKHSGKKKIEIFTEEERAELLDYMNKYGYQYDTIIKLAFATGMRQGELLGLRWEDISEDSISVCRSTAVVTHIDKNGDKDRYREVWDTKTENSVRTIPIRPSIYNMLKEHRRKQSEFFLKRGIANEGYVFTTENGRLIDSSSLNKSYGRLLNRAGIPHRKFHAIRHTFATEAIRRGVDVKDLQMLMGHADLQTTYIYVQSDENSKRKAIELIGEIM